MHLDGFICKHVGGYIYIKLVCIFFLSLLYYTYPRSTFEPQFPACYRHPNRTPQYATIQLPEICFLVSSEKVSQQHAFYSAEMGDDLNNEMEGSGRQRLFLQLRINLAHGWRYLRKPRKFMLWRPVSGPAFQNAISKHEADVRTVNINVFKSK